MRSKETAIRKGCVYINQLGIQQGPAVWCPILWSIAHCFEMCCLSIEPGDAKRVRPPVGSGPNPLGVDSDLGMFGIWFQIQMTKWCTDGLRLEAYLSIMVQCFFVMPSWLTTIQLAQLPCVTLLWLFITVTPGPNDGGQGGHFYARRREWGQLV